MWFNYGIYISNRKKEEKYRFQSRKMPKERKWKIFSYRLINDLYFSILMIAVRMIQIEFPIILKVFLFVVLPFICYSLWIGITVNGSKGRGKGDKTHFPFSSPFLFCIDNCKKKIKNWITSSCIGLSDESRWRIK